VKSEQCDALTVLRSYPHAAAAAAADSNVNATTIPPLPRPPIPPPPAPALPPFPPSTSIEQGVRTRRATMAQGRAFEARQREAAALVIQRNYRRARRYRKCSYKQSKDSALKIQRYYRMRAQMQKGGASPPSKAAAAAATTAGKPQTSKQEAPEAAAPAPETEASLNAKLLDAVQGGRGVRVCEELLLRSADVNARDLGPDGVTPLFAAVQAAAALEDGDATAAGTEALTVVSMLLRFKASANECVRSGEAPLHVAARLNCVAAVNVLLRDAAAEAGLVAAVAVGSGVSVGCDVNVKHGASGETPLAVAAKKEHEAMIRLLLDSGGVVDERTPAFRRGDVVEAKFQVG
jgi:hypothetical protein